MNRRENFRAALTAEGASEEEIREALAELDVEEEGRDRHVRARRAGVPPLYLGVGFEDLDMDERREAVLAVRNWTVALTSTTADELAERRETRDVLPVVPGLLAKLAAGEAPAHAIPRGVYLWSDGDDSEDTGFGSGKTRIAAAAAQLVVASRAFAVRWLDVVRLMTDLNLGFNNPQYERASRLLERPAENAALILDDIDKVPPTDRNLQPIFALLNDCVNSETPLLITANRHPDDLQADWGDRFGHAAASRIIGHCLDIEVRGRDRRLDAAAG